MKKILLFIIMSILNLHIFSMEIGDDFAIDNYGNKIKLKEYNKIIVADPAAVEIFYLIHGEDKISAIARTKINKIYPKDKTDKLLSIGSINNPSFEKILSLKPDLVILNPMGASKIKELLKEFNIPYFIDRTTTFEDIFLKTKIYGILTGQKKNADNLIFEKEKRLKAIKEEIEENRNNKNTKDNRLKGLILYSSSPMTSFSQNTIPGEILKFLEVRNLADVFFDIKSPIISSEFILKENPDFIIGTMKIKSVNDIIDNNEYLKYSNAYKNNNIFIFETDIILRGTPKIVDGIEEIYNTLKVIKNK